MIAHLILQSALSLFAAAFSGNVVTLDYSLVMPGAKTPTSGHAAFSDTAFRIQDDRQEIWCNGSERWIVDRTEQEVCVEPVDGIDASSIMKLFSPVSEDPSGKVVLKPVGEAESFMKGLVLYFSGTFPQKAEITLAEGSKPIMVTFSSQQIKDPESESFTFDVLSLPESYVVTDLR